MRKFAHIFNGSVYGIYESEGVPEFASNIVLVEITELDPQPQEGWNYDGTFFRPPSDSEPVLTMEEMQIQTLLNTEYLVILSELNSL